MAPIDTYPVFAAPLWPLWHVTSFILGCCIGSFLNVCIWRIPNHMSLSFPPSHCPKCQHRIRWYENIPLFSWLMLRGRCSNCHQPISPRYFGVELLVGALFFLLWLKVLLLHQSPAELLLDYIVTSFLVVIAFIDLDCRLILNRLNYPLMLTGLAWAVIFPRLWNTDHRGVALGLALIALVGTGAVMALLALFGRWLLKQDALGWGDVKYMMAIAACLGIRGAFFTLLIGSLVGSLVGLVLVAGKKGKLNTVLPFGPFLTFGTLFWLFWAERIPVWLWQLNQAIRALW